MVYSDRILSWTEAENILADENTGFYSGYSLMKQALILSHLAEKHGNKPITALDEVFC